MRFFALCVLITLGCFTGTALAADAVNTASDPSFNDITKAIFDAMMHSQWWVVASYAVVLACIGARKYMPATWKTGTKGDVVGLATTFLIAGAGALATAALAPGATMTFAVIATAAKIGLGAVGGYTIIHKVAGWLAEAGWLPAWALPIVKLLAALVGSNAVTKAVAAGQAAVDAKPATGAAGDNKIIEVE